MLAPDLETSVFGRSTSFSGYLQGICKCYLMNKVAVTLWGIISLTLDSVLEACGGAFQLCLLFNVYLYLVLLVLSICASTAEELAGDHVFH